MDNPYAEPTSTTLDRPLTVRQRCYALVLGIVVALFLAAFGYVLIDLLVEFPAVDSEATDSLTDGLPGVTGSHLMAISGGLITLTVATLAGLHIYRKTMATFHSVAVAEQKTQEIADQVIELRRQLADGGETVGSSKP